MIKLPFSYTQHLKSSKPVYINPSEGKKGLFKASRDSSSDLLIPPLNTNISFDSATFYTPKYSLLRALPELPETWDWMNTYSSDTPEILNKKQNVSSSGNQRHCGSCWAISTASVVSDLFVMSGYVKQNPKLSTTYSLSCFPQGQCNGGNPSDLFNDIENNGIVDDTCIDYSWCVNNENCNGSALKHFEEAELNSLVPSCGCYYDTPHYVYKITNIKRIGMKSDSDNQSANTLQVKNHIYNVGTCLGGFIVFDNFMSGNFTKVNNGIYFENGDYTNRGEIKFGHKPEYKGSHAISIVGWGVGKNTKTSNNTTEDVPYWYCRNSWTEKWGDNGCFKMAMYPFNKMSQFDKIVQIQAPDGIHQAGGFLLCTPSGPPTVQTLSKTNYSGKKDQSDSFYMTLPTVFSSGFLVSYSKRRIINILIFILVVSVIGYLIYKKRKSMQQKLM